jgi:hypothetical protein
MTSTEVQKIKMLITKLTDEQRTEIKRFIDDYGQRTFSEQRSINESFKSLGPTASYGCPMCGK